MSIERTYYCDGPENPDIPSEDEQSDRCPHHVCAVCIDGEYIPGGFLSVRWHVQGAIYEDRHFCSWDCLLRYAGQQPPVEYIT